MQVSVAEPCVHGKHQDGSAGKRGHRQGRKSSLIPVWAQVQTTLSRAQALNKLVISHFFLFNQDLSVPKAGPVVEFAAEDLN